MRLFILILLLALESFASDFKVALEAQLAKLKAPPPPLMAVYSQQRMLNPDNYLKKRGHPRPQAQLREWMDSNYYHSFSLLKELAEDFPTPGSAPAKTYPPHLTQAKIIELKKHELEAWKFGIVEALSYSKNQLVASAFWDLTQRSSTTPTLRDFIFDRFGFVPNITAGQYLVKCVETNARHRERCLVSMGNMGTQETTSKLSELALGQGPLNLKILAIKSLGSTLNPTRPMINEREFNQGLRLADETLLKLVLTEELGKLEPTVIEALITNQYMEALKSKYESELKKSNTPKVASRLKKILGSPGRLMPRKPVKSEY